VNKSFYEPSLECGD